MNISKVTRRNIFDWLTVERVNWCGRLKETEFLSRLYDLEAIHSTDARFRTATGDIWQHCINNSDWEPNWVYTDSRFELMSGSDEVFLRFLCEMLHPIIRPNQEEVGKLLSQFNSLLGQDGWQLVESSRISNAPVFSARPVLATASIHLKAAREGIANVVDSSYISQQITRLESAIPNDPELAIGTAKEFVESICKTILDEFAVPEGDRDTFPKRVRATLKKLKLVAGDIPDSASASETIKVLLNNLATISNGLAELRNLYGTGHGKVSRTKGLQSRHARLAVGAAVTLAVFIFETHLERKLEQ